MNVDYDYMTIIVNEIQNWYKYQKSNVYKNIFFIQVYGHPMWNGYELLTIQKSIKTA